MNKRFILTAGSASCLLAGVTALGLWSKTPMPASASEAEPPTTINLTGVVRDFTERTLPNGHPDFERKPSNGFGHYAGNIGTTLGSDGKPVFLGGGHKVAKQWKDAANRKICYALYNPALGDQAGVWGPLDSGGVQSASTFDQWFRDIPGANMSAPLTLTLVLDANGSYVFDDKLDPYYDNKGGFFPIDDQLNGNSPGMPQHNYHFTFELHTQFTYDASANQVFKFIGDDDVLVYIDGKLVIDLCGVHAAIDQFVDLNRLGLTDGQLYTLDFFFAERHRTQSNFRIQTNLIMNSGNVPSITSSYD